MKISILDDYFDTLRISTEIQFSDIFDQIMAHAKGTPINVVNPQVFDVLKTR